jgi:ferric-dicitrate binding protein FerR (iron transport regulator)
MTPQNESSDLRDVELLVRYAQGSDSGDEHSRIEATIATNPALAQRIATMQAAQWDGERKLDAAWTAIRKNEARTSDLSSVRREIGTEQRGYPIAGGRLSLGSSRSSLWVRPWISAVAVAMLLGIVFLGRSMTHDNSVNLGPQARTYTTSTGEHANIGLRDGSRVSLAPQSSLKITESFGKTTRTVTLMGEAVFDVSAASGAPFTVRTGSITTRVLGTRFAVRHYGVGDAVQIIVLSGKVSAAGSRRGAVTVTAGMIARMTDSTVATARGGDVSRYVSWTRGQLAFDDVPVSTVLSALGRWYGYTFRVTDSTIANRHVTVSFKTNAATETLEDLKDLLDVSLSIEGKTVTLNGRRTTMPQRVPQSRRHYDIFHHSTEVGR